MKPTLAHKPNGYPTTNLLMKFADGKPLTCDELNFLDWHARTLSNLHLDPVIKYYLKHYRHDHADDHSFLLTNDHLDKDSTERLKRRLTILLKEKSHVEFKLKPELFLQFRALTYDELILYHGNQLLTGAPFHQGGIPQVIFFQWGNLFGVAKYVILAEEKALKSNILIYFEDLQDRLLARCVDDYVKTHQHDFQHQIKLTPSMHPQPEPQNNDVPQEEYRSIFQTPKLTLSPLKELQDEDA